MSVFVTNVVPNKVLTGQAQEISLAGKGFSGNVRVCVNNLFLPAFFVSDRLVKFVLPYIVAGIYDITVVNGDNSSWIDRVCLTITDPPPGALPDLGTAARPMVLPPMLVDVPARTNVTTAVQQRNYTSPASVTLNSTSGVLTANLKQDPSYLPEEGIPAVNSQPRPTTGQTLKTPWGTFVNE